MGQLTAREILLGVLNWVLLTILFGALASWIWTIRRLWTHQPLLPEEPLVERRKTPWGVGTVLLVLVVYVLVSRYGLEWYALANRGETPRNQAAAPIRIEKKDAEHPDAEESLPWGLSLTELMFAQAAISEVLIILLPGLIWLTSGARLRDLGLSLAGWRRQAAVGIGRRPLPAADRLRGPGGLRHVSRRPGPRSTEASRREDAPGRPLRRRRVPGLPDRGCAWLRPSRNCCFAASSRAGWSRPLRTGTAES